VALAGTRASGQATGRGWHWRGEVSLVLGVLRSPYPYLLTVAAVLAIGLVYQIGSSVGVQIGGGYDEPYVRSFHDREAKDGVSYRYATDRSRVLLPGAGARNSTLVIDAGRRPDGVAQPVQVIVNGIALGQFTPGAGIAEYRFPLPANYYSYGDLTVDLISTPQLVEGKGNNQVPYGPQIAGVHAVAEGGGLVKPPLWTLVAWLVIGPMVYFLIRRLGLRPPVAAGVALALLAVGAAAVAAQRLDFAIFAPRLAFLLIVAYLLLIVSDLTVPRLFARGGVAIEERTWRWLQLIALFPLALKLGGAAYPQLVVIDEPWHNQRFEQVLTGRFMEIYRPTAGGISELPGQWGMQGQIPYPPFLYVFGLPFYLWPLGKEISFNLWSVLLDCTRPLLVFFLARRLGASVRASLIGAVVMGMTACTFLLHSWGNWPTTVSQWCALLFIVLLVARFDDLRRPWVFAGLLALLTVTMLLYTVTAVFIGMLLVIFIGALLWRGGAAARRQLLPLSGLLVGASLLAFFAYYVQFVGPILTQTLPSFGSSLGEGESLGITRDPFTVYASKYFVRLFNYGVLFSLLLAPLGAWRLLRGEHNRLAGPLLAAWFAIPLSFFLIGYRIDMVDKEIWFIVPALAVCAGVACDAIIVDWRRWATALWLRFPFSKQRQTVSRWWQSVPSRVRQLPLGPAIIALYLAHLTWGGVTLWLFRIMVTRH
jgi:hypothetical protein